MRAHAPVVEGFVLDCRELFGDELLSVFLFGSAVTGDFRPGVSEYNLAVVLKEVRPALLKLASARLAGWRTSGLDFPLFLDPRFIRAGLRIFPIEFAEMKRGHRMLYGPDPLLGLPERAENLRTQCEYELRAKLLALRQGYVEAAASSPKVLTLARDSLKPFLIVLRNVLTLLGESPQTHLTHVLDRVEARWGLALPACRRLLAVRAGDERVKRAEIDALFAAYLDEISAVAERFPGAPEMEAAT